MTTFNWKKLSWWVGGLVLLAALATPGFAAGQHSVSAMIQETFEFNGEVFGPSTVTVREVSHYNPGTTMNEIWVDSRCLVLMLAAVSRASASPGADDRIIFERRAAGNLVLVGFAYHDQSAVKFYGYETASTGGRWSSPAGRSTERVAVVLH